MSKLKLYGAGILLLLAIIGIPTCSYHYDRWKNYKFGYESQVRESVCNMVKPEALINPSDCN